VAPPAGQPDPLQPPRLLDGDGQNGRTRPARRHLHRRREGSWEDDAAVRDKSAGIFTRPNKVHVVDHDGPYYQLHAAALAEPSPQRTPVLYQAGSSERGTRFAGRHAEAVFLNSPTPAIAARSVRALREAARDAGRDPYDILAFIGATVILAATTAEAMDLRDDYLSYLHPEGQLALVSGWTGVDLSKLGLEDPLPFGRSNAIRSTLDNLTVRATSPVSVKDLLAFSPAGARAPVFIGSPVDVADQMEAWADATDVDGFNLVRTVMPESLEATVDLLVPELQSRGRFKKRYEDGTLRQKLFPSGGRTLPERHPGAAYRHRR
jgi:FMN-dependent oxidoreductase (nitrilotriacetate monooxygenase family)